MAVRSGMRNLITRLRPMAAAGTADFTLAGLNYWTDEQLQDRLDQYSTLLQRARLEPVIEYNNGTALYQEYRAMRGNLEEATSGTLYWEVENSDGDNAGTANYTVDYIKGVIRFTNDQAGTAYYLRGRSYDLNRAAAAIWREKMAYGADFYNFSTDNHSFSREQFFAHCQRMADYYERQSGGSSAKMVRGDLV